jgi:hypothetical protein
MGRISCNAHEWEVRIYGRLSAMPVQAAPLQRAQLLAALSVGTEILRLRRATRRLGHDMELNEALDAFARGDGSAAVECLGQLDRILAELSVPGAAARIMIRARGSILAISEALTHHAAYFNSEAVQ